MKCIELMLCATLLILFVVSSSFAEITDGLVAYFPLNGDAIDLTNNGHHGKVNGANPTKDRFGNIQGAIHFSGNDYISVSSSPTLCLSNVSTISAWFRLTPTTAGTSNTILSTFQIDSESEDGYAIIIEKVKEKYRVLFVAQDGSKPLAKEPFFYINDIKAWHHVVWMNYGDRISGYFDGFHIGTGPQLAKLTTGNSNPLLIGAMQNGGPKPGNYFSGDIDDVRIYNRTFPECEIVELYTEDSD